MTHTSKATMKPAYILTENSLTVTIDGTTTTINSSHPSWRLAIECLKKKDYASLQSALSVKTALHKYTNGKVEVQNGCVIFNGEPIHNYLSSKILHFVQLGLPHEPLVKFLERLMANPSSRAINELYQFLQHKNLPITDSGTFLAYKSVRNDYTDHHSGKFDNSVGSTLEMPRNCVDDNYQHGCSHGFHAGSLQYASSFGGSDSILLIVEIDPADVVSVPSDNDCQKLRTCKYKVISKYSGPLPEHYSEQDHITEDNSDDDFDDNWDDEDPEEQVLTIAIKHGNKVDEFVRDSKGRFTKKQ